MGNIPLCCMRSQSKHLLIQADPVKLNQYHASDTLTTEATSDSGPLKGLKGSQEPSIYDNIFGSIHEENL